VRAIRAFVNSDTAHQLYQRQQEYQTESFSRYTLRAALPYHFVVYLGEDATNVTVRRVLPRAISINVIRM